MKFNYHNRSTLLSLYDCIVVIVIVVVITIYSILLIELKSIKISRFRIRSGLNFVLQKYNNNRNDIIIVDSIS